MVKSTGGKFMLNDKSAITMIKKLYPDLVIVSALRFPKMYAFFMTKEGEELTTDDAWYCLDLDGNEQFINPLSDPELLSHARIIDLDSDPKELAHSGTLGFKWAVVHKNGR